MGWGGGDQRAERSVLKEGKDMRGSLSLLVQIRDVLLQAVRLPTASIRPQLWLHCSPDWGHSRAHVASEPSSHTVCSRDELRIRECERLWVRTWTKVRKLSS